MMEELGQKTHSLGIDKGKLGGGIPDHAAVPYRIWSTQVVHRLGVDLNQLLRGVTPLDPNLVANAWEKSSATYSRYRMVRDYAIFASRGRIADYFPDAETHLDYLIQWYHAPGLMNLEPERAAAIKADLKGQFGAEALLGVVEKLRQAKTTGPSTLADPSVLGLPEHADSPMGAFYLLLFEATSPRGVAVLSLMGSTNISRVQDGVLRLDAMIEKYGESKVLETARAMQDGGLDHTGGQTQIAAGPYAGLGISQVLPKRFPLEVDPVALAREAAEREAQRQRRAAEEAAKIEAARRGRALAEEHFDAFVHARGLAIKRDRAVAERVHQAGNEDWVNPHTWRNRVDAMAGLWNDFGRSGEQNAGAWAASQLPRTKQKDPLVAEIVRTLAFLRGYRGIDGEALAPLEVVQQDRLEAGTLDPSQRLDLRLDRERYKLEKRIFGLESLIDSEERRALMPHMKREAELKLAPDRAELASLRASLAAMDAAAKENTQPPAPYSWAIAAATARAEAVEQAPAQIEAKRQAERQAEQQAKDAKQAKELADGASASEDHLDAFLKAMELAKKLDQLHLDHHNQNLAENQKPREVSREFRDAVRMSQGAWNEFGSGDQRARSEAAAALRPIRNASFDHPLKKELLDTLDFFNTYAPRRKQVGLRPLADVQRDRIEAGTLAPADALDLSCTREVRAVMVDLQAARAKLRKYQDVVDKQPKYADRYQRHIDRHQAEVQQHEKELEQLRKP